MRKVTKRQFVGQYRVEMLQLKITKLLKCPDQYYLSKKMFIHGSEFTLEIVGSINKVNYVKLNKVLNIVVTFSSHYRLFTGQPLHQYLPDSISIGCQTISLIFIIVNIAT